MYHHFEFFVCQNIRYFMTDVFRVIVPQLEHTSDPTKRWVTSAEAHFYDILGWFSPK